MDFQPKDPAAKRPGASPEAWVPFSFWKDAKNFGQPSAGGREQTRLGACATGIIESGLSLNIELKVFRRFCELDVPG